MINKALLGASSFCCEHLRRCRQLQGVDGTAYPGVERILGTILLRKRELFAIMNGVPL
jgi:hypothetical protein